MYFASILSRFMKRTQWIMQGSKPWNISTIDETFVCVYLFSKPLCVDTSEGVHHCSYYQRLLAMKCISPGYKQSAMTYCVTTYLGLHPDFVADGKAFVPWSYCRGCMVFNDTCTLCS